MIGDGGAKSLGDALKLNSTLINLDLGNNSIGLLGAQSLGDGLKANSTLKILRLDANVTDGLCDGLKSNSSITRPQLNGRISPESVRSLRDALNSNTSITKLHSGDFRPIQGLKDTLEINKDLKPFSKWPLEHFSLKIQWRRMIEMIALCFKHEDMADVATVVISHVPSAIKILKQIRKTPKLTKRQWIHGKS